MPRTLFLATKTTGQSSKTDELLEIAVCDEFRHPLLNSLIQPIHKTEWPHAQAIHGISPTDVEDAPTLEELRGPIRELVADCHVVLYNEGGDSPLLGEHRLLNGALWVECAMILWAEYKSEHRDGRLKWHKLVTAAEEAGHVWGKDVAQRALTDARAIVSVWDQLEFVDIKKRLASGELCVYLTVDWGRRECFWFPDMTGAELEEWWQSRRSLEAYCWYRDLPGDLILSTYHGAEGASCKARLYNEMGKRKKNYRAHLDLEPNCWLNTPDNKMIYHKGWYDDARVPSPLEQLSTEEKLAEFLEDARAETTDPRYLPYALQVAERALKRLSSG
ncbi:3'-5' exonuclease [Dongshaea marina]|uniref:3'-5' exonuclease n=1 Tax=Dongshaea marina TaxID=2047966 RepID=UPI000D3E1A9A|nr:3'-5' exonuclease [Dongshaea marina]